MLFKFRSRTHGLNKELGRHWGREGKKECGLCGDECETVSRILWDCSVYRSTVGPAYCRTLRASAQYAGIFNNAGHTK